MKGGEVRAGRPLSGSPAAMGIGQGTRAIRMRRGCQVMLSQSGLCGVHGKGAAWTGCIRRERFLSCHLEVIAPENRTLKREAVGWWRSEAAHGQTDSAPP